MILKTQLFIVLIVAPAKKALALAEFGTGIWS